MEVIGIIIGIVFFGFLALVVGSVIRKETTKYEYKKTENKSYNVLQIIITLAIGLFALYLISNFLDGCSNDGGDEYRIIRRD